MKSFRIDELKLLIKGNERSLSKVLSQAEHFFPNPPVTIVN